MPYIVGATILFPSFFPLGATALGEPWPPQQPVSIALCLPSSLSTAFDFQAFRRHLFHATVLLTYIKAKAIPLQAWTGPEGSRRLWLPDFKTIGT
jgi:hypothetical protein